MLYLFLCPNKRQFEMLKLAQDVGQLKADQQNTEYSSARTKGHRYVKTTIYGSEFVHFMLTNKEVTLNEQFSQANRAYMRFVTRGRDLANRTLPSPHITNLLQDMTDASLRKLVLREQDHEPLPAKKEPREPNENINGRVRLGQAAAEVNLGFRSETREPSANRKRKTAERITGRLEGALNMQEVTGFNLRPRQRRVL